MTAETPAGVDVIVPVYNGHDHVQACLETLLANTPGADVGFLIADDASPDPRIPALLERFAARDGRVRVVRRPQNLGFVGNCNAAVRALDRDVVILNADTLVPPGWLDRIRRLAATSGRIATITPLSNNAEVAGVPQWLVPNDYPEGVDHMLLDEVAQATGTGEWIELPTAVGFAMYVRRVALDEVGSFNEELFGKGYGEENDLSCRFRHAGYLNLLCDDVFVAHVGGVSFAESGTGRLAENLATLGKEWPDYHGVVQDYIASNPLRGVQARFGVELLRRTKRPDRLRILYVLHNPIHGEAIGGTEFQTEDLVRAARDEADPLVLHVGDRGPVLQWAGPDFLLEFPVDEPGRDPEEWMRALFATGIDVVHIQHAMRIGPFDLRTFLELAEEYGVPVMWSLHDYHALCPGAQLLDAEDRTPCISLDPEPAAPCAGCDRKALRESWMTLAAWREFYGEHLERASMLVTPSRAGAVILEGAMPALAGRFTVLPHGLDHPRLAEAAPAPADPPYRIGVLGYGGPHKGDRVITALMEHLPGPEFEFHLFGRTELADVPDDAAAVFYGPYERSEIVEMMRDADLACVVLLSVWPETYSYTLSEAWAAGIPVFGADQGAIAERIGASGGGRVISIDERRLPATAASIRDTLRDPATMVRLAEEAAINGAALPTVDEMWRSYLSVYRSLAGAPRPAADRARLLPTIAEMRKWVGYLRSPLPAPPVGLRR
jgi:GT2 family glycosyltransferase